MTKEQIIKELEKSPDFIFIVTDTLTTPNGVTIESLAYMTKVNRNNRWGLKTFKDEAGQGYIIEKKVDSIDQFIKDYNAKPMVKPTKKTIKKNKPMKWKGQKKSKNVEDRRTAKPGRKIVTLKSLASDSEKKRTAAKKKKSTGLNGAVSATKTVRVSKAAGTKKDGTLKKGHRYVKGGGIVKVTSK